MLIMSGIGRFLTFFCIHKLQLMWYVASQLKAGRTWNCERSSSSQREPLRWWRASATEAADLGRRPGEPLPTDPPPVRAARSLQQPPPWPRWAAPPCSGVLVMLWVDQSNPHHSFTPSYLPQFNSTSFDYIFVCFFLASSDSFKLSFVNPCLFCFCFFLICHYSSESTTHYPKLW